MIPFNKPYIVGTEMLNIKEVINSHKLAGDYKYTKYCHKWLENHIGCCKVLLTHSCTAALEMAAILADINPGDEVIMPSYTFVSTANAFVLRGGVPVFVDIREDTLNINEQLIEAAITSHTKAIVPVHYAGVACEMDTILEIARRHKLLVIEDAAQGVGASYKGRALGSMGDLGTLSFHETKNISSGEGGALLVNKPSLVKRAEIIREKGTNRSQFVKGQVDKYTWLDIGSSYLPGEIVSAFLWAQLQEVQNITKKRIEIWNKYHNAFHKLAQDKKIKRPLIPNSSSHNAHMYYLLFKNIKQRMYFIESMKLKGVDCYFHYIPLHSSPGGCEYGRIHGDISNTNDLSDRLVRLPLWVGLDVDYVINQVLDVISTFKEDNF
jgi:dTDP-4-amino-4,6-dideoxygalactose transaminase|tara:strand:+ start:527 stop:1666 length:1140 start_codon:yes stop_codon:yes gene_type:complete